MSGGLSMCHRAMRAALVVVAAVLATSGYSARIANADPAEAKKIFTTRCMACHTFGKGAKVGPDLKGVTARRPRDWLVKFIRSSQAMIDSGDQVAVALFTEFKQLRMPDWTDLSEAQIGNILDWLGANGPEQVEPDERLAESATPEEIAAGRELFHGDRRLVAGGNACASCHSIRDEHGWAGGTLASDLTVRFSDFQDGALTMFLKHPCIQRVPESDSRTFLATVESFAIKAYLRHTALRSQQATPHGAAVAKSVDDTGQPGASPVAGATAPPTTPSGAARVRWEPKTAGLATRGVRGQLRAELLFFAFPYAALLVLLIGVAIRFAIARQKPSDIGPAASGAWELLSGNTIWKIGIGATFVLHLLGLVIPRALVAWNGVPARLYLLEASGFALGALALYGWVMIMRRHVGRVTSSPRAAFIEITDCIGLSLLGMAIVSGLVMAALYRWGTSWSAGTLSPYIASLFAGSPRTELIENMPFLVRLHVLAAFAVVAVIPFTSAAAIAVALLDRLVALAVRPINATARAGQRAAARLSPARWLWPEEDVIEPRPANPKLAPSSNAHKPS